MTHRRWLAAAAMLLPALLGVVVRAHVATRADTIARDGTVYLQMAYQMDGLPSAGMLRRYPYHPGYPAVVALAARATVGTDPSGGWAQRWARVGQAVSVAFSGVALLSLYVIGREALGRGVALVSVLLLALARPFVEVGADAISDAQAVALALAAIALALLARRAIRAGRVRAVALAALAGVVAGAGYLTRPEELLAGAVAVALLAAVRGLTRRRRGLQAACVAAAVATLLACVVPYAVAIGGLTLKKSVGDFVFAGGGLPLAAARGGAGFLPAVRVVVDRLRASVGTPVAALAIVCWATWFGRYVLRLRLPRGVLVVPGRVGWAALFALPALLLPLLVALEMQRGLGYVSSRHALPAALLLGLCAGAGVAILIEWSLWIGQKLGLRRRPGLAVSCWVVGILLAMAVFALPRLHEGKWTYRSAGLHVRAVYGPGLLVLSPDGWAPFYAEAPAAQYQFGSPVEYHLHPPQAKTAASLLGRATDRAGRPRYDFLVISRAVLPRGDAGQAVLAGLIADPRFTSRGVFGKGKHRVYLFGARHVEPTTTPGR